MLLSRTNHVPDKFECRKHIYEFDDEAMADLLGITEGGFNLPNRIQGKGFGVAI